MTQRASPNKRRRPRALAFLAEHRSGGVPAALRVCCDDPTLGLEFGQDAMAPPLFERSFGQTSVGSGKTAAIRSGKSAAPKKERDRP